ncbi:helix-turn-helix domain-containing protein [Fulvivirga maritima]|uniref:helix-turn-helix domain-containing protein n=1 Tax=Fulvivirga maritima TaxID=2904247 RepID=UPI001F1F4AF8|nr:helix-turn-helix transcriptional regulator [Fulvivirga maritima]UII29113.1 helix-turn-helix domain-containing protein [Fulvivirga maritima]
MTNYKTIAARILTLRKQQSLTLEELGSKMEVITGRKYDRHVVWAYEKGKRKVPSELIPVFASIFKVPMELLFFTEHNLEDQYYNTESLSKDIIKIKKWAETAPYEACQKAIKCIKDASHEIIRLKQEMEKYKAEAKSYQIELDTIKPLFLKIEKYVHKISEVGKV